jgi:hypothetical protein
VEIAGVWVKVEKKALLALFDVHFGCGINEAKSGWGVNHFQNLAQIHRPKPQRMYFDGNDLFWLDLRLGIDDARPAEIEHCPLLECPFSRGKLCLSMAND